MAAFAHVHGLAVVKTSRARRGSRINDHFAVLAYRASAKIPPSANPGSRKGRGLPDIADDADPQSRYAERVDGQNPVIGGTSAAAMRDITVESIGADEAQAGWHTCTGPRVPDGRTLIAAWKWK